MEFSEEAKKVINEVIEGKGQELYEDIVTATDDLNILCKETQEAVGIKASELKKMIAFYFENNLEEKKAKVTKIFDMYEDIRGEE